jgi:hypothetical protein
MKNEVTMDMIELIQRIEQLELAVAALKVERKAPPGEFDQFWTAYPKKVGKQAALKAFKNAKFPSLDALLKAIDRARLSEQWRKDGGQFIPNPATWLNQGRWDDEPVQVVPVQPKAQVRIDRATERAPYIAPPAEVLALLSRIGKGF